VDAAADRLGTDVAETQHRIAAAHAELRTVHERVQQDVDFTPVTEPLAAVHRPVDAAADRLGTDVAETQHRIAAAHAELRTVHERVQQDVDFTPVTEPLAAVHRAVDAAADRLGTDVAETQHRIAAAHAELRTVHERVQQD